MRPHRFQPYIIQMSSFHYITAGSNPIMRLGPVPSLCSQMEKVKTTWCVSTSEQGNQHKALKSQLVWGENSKTCNYKSKNEKQHNAAGVIRHTNGQHTFCFKPTLLITSDKLFFRQSYTRPCQHDYTTKRYSQWRAMVADCSSETHLVWTRASKTKPLGWPTHGLC